MSPYSFTWAALGVCGALLYAGCSIDDRVLSSDESLAGAEAGGSINRAGASAGGGIDSSAASGGAGAGAGPVSEAGQGGEGGGSEAGAPSFPDGCADLNRDRISDCTQTLLQNSTFTSDATDWLPETGVTVAWDPLDLLGAAGSGSLTITSSGAIDAAGNSLKAASQCVTVHADKLLDIYANVHIDPSAIDGSAALSLWFYPLPDCPGDTSEVYLAAQTSTTDETLVLQATQAVPTDMVSLRVRLSVIKPFRADGFSVRFDNLLLVEH